MTISSKLQLTLGILKPDISQVPHIVQAVNKMILRENILIIQDKRLQLTEAKAEEFYAEHKGKFFYNRLTTFMSSGPIHAYILAHENAIKKWRQLIGPTKVYQTQFSAPNSIRGLYGLSDTRNTTHGSDSPETARKEIQFFFPEFDYDMWMNKDELLLRRSPNS